jgi:hypothetical protein
MSILRKLSGGDLRSIGKSNEVVSNVLKKPGLFKLVVEGIRDPDPIIRMRSADVVEKVSRKNPEYLQPYKEEILHDLSQIDQKEVKWHIAQMISYLDLTETERSKAFSILERYTKSNSAIVVVFSVESLAKLALKDDRFKKRVIKIIKKLKKSGKPSVTKKTEKVLKKII